MIYGNIKNEFFERHCALLPQPLGLALKYLRDNDMANATPALVTEPFSNGVEAVSYNAPAKDLATPEKLAQQEQRVQMIMNNQSIEPTRTAQHAELSNEEKAKAQTSANQPVEQPQK